MSRAPAPTRPNRPALLERLALHRPELRAWVLYDWANSAMWTVVITVVFPVFYGKVAAVGFTEDEIRRQFGLVTMGAMLVAALIGPVLGAMADHAPIKKKLFAIFFALGVASTAALFFLRTGDWILAGVLFALANIGISTSFVFYDTFLPHLARRGEADRLSTTGFAAGYLGGGLCLALCVALIRWDVTLGIDEPDGLSARVGFLLVAVWWLVFTIPFLRRVREPRLGSEALSGPALSVIGLFRASFSRIGETLRELKHYRQALLLLLAFLLYSDGIGTVNRMAVVFAMSVKMLDDRAVEAMLAVQFVAVPFAILFGKLSDRIGAKKGILIALVGYVGVCVWASRMESTWDFIGIMLIVATVQGGSQALSRSLFSTMIPKRKAGEFFGLFSTLDKFAGILGPLLFSLAPSIRTAALWVIGLFVAGGVILAFVDVEEGRRAANAKE